MRKLLLSILLCAGLAGAQVSMSVADKTDSLDKAITASIADKSVRDFVCAKTASCNIGEATPVLSGWDANKGWIYLADSAAFHEMDRRVVWKYNLQKTMRPDLDKPDYDVFFWYISADGKKERLCTKKEQQDSVRARPSTDETEGVK